MSVEAQASVIQHLRSELNLRGLESVNVAASDENTYDGARATWEALDDDTRQSVGQVNVHGYQYGKGRRDLLRSAVGTKSLWNTEYADGDASGMSLARNLNLDLRWLRCTGWCYWQLVDEADGWGLLRFDSSKLEVEGPNTKYWVFAHYSRHIRAGMYVLDSGDDDTIAAYDVSARKLVLVTVNYDEGSRNMAYDLSRFTLAAGPVSRWTTDTAHEGMRYTKVRYPLVSGPRLTSELSRNTVQTLEVSNVEW